MKIVRSGKAYFFHESEKGRRNMLAKLVILLIASLILSCVSGIDDQALDASGSDKTNGGNSETGVDSGTSDMDDSSAGSQSLEAGQDATGPKVGEGGQQEDAGDISFPTGGTDGTSDSGGKIEDGGTGGTSGGGDTGGDYCPELPSCNWCQGTPVVDDRECIVSWLCPNGVDPCVTAECQGPEDCGPNEECRFDMLCWPSEARDCGSLGTACTGDESCGAGLACPVNVCVPARRGCGGFAGWICEDTSHACFYHNGSDFGACLSSEEQACICSTDAGRDTFSDCVL